MAESYIENFKSKVDFPKPFQRTGKFPIDRTDLFSSYEDAVKYARGDRSDPDSRGLCGTSYVGQIITVFENDDVTVYKINADRTLSEIGSRESCVKSIATQIEVGGISASVSIPEGCKFVSVDITDNTTGEQIFTDVSHSGSIVTVSIAEAYVNPLDIVVFYST